MNWADWAIIVILTLSSVISLARGFIKEALSLVIWVAAMVIANVFSNRLEPLFTNIIETPSLRTMAAFAAVFLAVLLLGALLNFALGMVVKATGLSGTDRLIGMLFGFVRGLFIVMLLLIYLPVKNDPWYAQSTLIPYFSPYETAVKNVTGEMTRWLLNLVSKSESTKV